MMRTTTAVLEPLVISDPLDGIELVEVRFDAEGEEIFEDDEALAEAVRYADAEMAALSLSLMEVW